MKREPIPATPMGDLLYLSHRLPYPPDSADKLRSYNTLRFLSQHYRVHLGCFYDDDSERKYLGKMRALCYETCFVQHAPVAARLRGLKSLLRGQSMSLPYYMDSALAAWVERLLRRQPVRSVLAAGAPMAQYLLLAQGDGLRRVADFTGLDSEAWRHKASGLPWPASAICLHETQALLAYERGVARQFDHTTFACQAEAATFQRLAPDTRGKVAFFNNGVDADYFSPHILHRSPYTGGTMPLVFTGAMDDWPTIEAADWFVRNVFAHLYDEHSAVRFYIVGARPSQKVQALARHPGVVVTGAVPDIRPYLAHAALAVAPLRVARGLQNKVLEAMAMQKIVVASPQSLDGLAARTGSEVLAASDAHEFVRHIKFALSAGSTREIEMAARARVLSDYSWSNNLMRLAALLGQDSTERSP